jgi:ribosome-binding protein aMBF1 (putative translation factor)
MKKNNIRTLDQFIDEEIGKRGTKKRIQQARQEKGMTQEQLADLA